MPAKEDGILIILGFLAAFLIPLAVLLYAFNFVRWLWRGHNVLPAIGASTLTIVAAVFTIAYLVSKLLF